MSERMKDIENPCLRCGWFDNFECACPSTLLLHECELEPEPVKRAWEEIATMIEWEVEE